MTDIKKLKPKYIPVKCAVCNGFGTVNWGQSKCHGCDGRGYILIPPEEKEEKQTEGRGCDKRNK